jgi:hypothetical protein
MPVSKPTVWWRRKRKPHVWHFMKDCPSLKFDDADVLVSKNPRNGTKCDHCQRLQKAARGK